MVTAPLVEAPQLDPAWIRAVLFEHGVDDWVDCAVDPETRHWVGRLFADQVEAAYLSWKWWSDRSGLPLDDPPPEATLPAALASAINARTWTELVCATATVGLAQSLLFKSLADTDDAGQRRTFERPAVDSAAHAERANAYLASGHGMEPGDVTQHLERLAKATETWLSDLDLPEVLQAWQRR